VKRRKRVLFVGPCKRYFRSFMQQDLELLRKQFDVKVVHVCFDISDLRGTLMVPLRLTRGIAWTDVVFCWFASREAFAATALSKPFSKKIAVAVGGGDVTCIPELGYGNALHKTAHIYQKYVLTNVTKVLPDSKDAEKGTLEFVNDSAKVTMIYLGIDIEKFCPHGRKQDKAITVGAVSRSNLKRKGLETFVNSAAYLPDVEFVLIGQFMDDSINYLRSIAPKNVRFIDFLPESELIKHYQEAKVYVQVSAHEAFGASLAEAMASGCVPVVTDKGAIPEVVGNTGIYVPYGDPAAVAAGILEALKWDTGKFARERIEKMFTVDKRQEALLRTVNNMFG
jgi:glycosyltransferase involved in cell wall biosynthesis